VPAVAMIAVLICTPIATVLLRRAEVLDIPTVRSSHDVPTPRGGGVVLALGLVAGAALATSVDSGVRATLVAAAVAFGLLGLAEDLAGVPVRRRLAVQVVFAGALGAVVANVLGTGIVFGAFAAVWLVGFVNIFNFMDGIDGIAAGQTIVAGGAWILLGMARGDDVARTLGAITAASAIGFLPSNFPRARVFMGDAGSYGIAAWLATGSVVLVARGLGAPAVLAPFVLFVFDGALAIVSRLLRGEPVHLPHRSHVYQRLAARWGHPRTTLLACGLMSILAALGRIASEGSLVVRGCAIGSAALFLLAYAGLPRLARGSKVDHCAGLRVREEEAFPK